MPEFLNIEALAKTDDNNGGVKISGVAYSGGAFAQTWDGRPIVLSLSGLEFSPQIPLMNSHWNSTSKKLGEVTASVADNQLLIAGTITSQSEDAQQIIADGKKSDWQLSMGADILQKTIVEAGQTVEINGRQFNGPLVNVVKAKLREVSVVAVGADAETNMKIAAKFNLALNLEGENKMEKEPEVKAAANASAPAVAAVAPVTAAPVNKHKTDGAAKAEPVQAVAPAVNAERGCASVDVQEAVAAALKEEHARVSGIQAICAGEFPDVETEAISANWDLDTTRAKVLEKLRASRPATGPNVIVKGDMSADRNSLECALCLRSGISEDFLSKSYDAKSIEAGMCDMDISLKDVVKECLRMAGQPVHRSIDDCDIQTAFSSVTLPGILGNVANKSLLQSYAAAPVIAFKFCTIGNLTDFKETDRFRLTDVGDLHPVAADGEVKDGGVSEESAKNQLETYAKKFCLTRKMIINDDLNAFTKVPVAMGNRAARLIDQLFFSRLTANPNQGDGNALFSAAHSNLLTGETSALSKDSLQAGIQKFLDQKDSDGQPIAVEPRFLLVPTGLKFTAQELLKGAVLIAAGSTDTLRPGYNALSETNIEPVSSPYLNSDSTTAWYLFGDPRQVDTFEIGFLKGKRTPTIERGETDMNTLGMWFRVFFDIGIREQDHRGMVKSNGAA